MAALLPVDIANMALALLTEAAIDSLEEDSKPARLLKLHYDTTREAELSRRIWTFAVLSAEIDGVATADGRYAYALPADCLRPLPPTFYDLPDGVSDYFRAEGDELLLYSGGTRRISYVGNLIDPGDWPALFTEVLSAALAIKLAHAVTGKASMIQVAQSAYDRALSEASRVNAIMRPPGRNMLTWAQARGDWRVPGVGVGGGYGARSRHGGGW